MDDKTRVYLINVMFLLFAIFGPPFLYFIFTGHLSWEEFAICMAFAVLPLIGFLYGLRYMKKHFGPEWYRVKDNIPPEVGKLPKVRFFEGVCTLVFFLSIIYVILTRDLVGLVVFLGASYVIGYQGYRERLKYLPPDARKIYERGYKIVFFVWLCFLLELIARVCYQILLSRI